MANSLPLMIILMLLTSISWVCWLELDDILASLFVAGTLSLIIIPGLFGVTQRRRRSL